MKQLSFGIVIAALAVSAPRLTLAFLIGDAVVIPEQTEVLILTLTGIASGMVLTVGNAVLAHALASKAQQRSSLWWLCAAAWGMFLIGAIVLVAPTLTMGLRRSPLAEVMGSSTAEWIWAVMAVVIVELLVGAAMAAMILVDEPEPEVTHMVKPSRWGRLLDAAVDRAAGELAGARRLAEGQPSTGTIPVSPGDPDENGSDPVAGTLAQANEKRARAKQDALAQVIAILRLNPTASLEEIGQQVGRKKSTISGYLDELEQRGRLRRSEAGVTVLDMPDGA
ncbi:MAG: hypothetical protein R2867_02755 [Caldilineaceae bacterium]